jgi:class 3 adenylate cyclase
MSGNGINIAQRVMNCGDAGRIVLSKSVADELNRLGEWSVHLQDRGEQIVEHGERVHVFNLYMGEVGSP